MARTGKPALTEFYNWMIREGYATATAVVYQTNVRSIIRKAVKAHVASREAEGFKPASWGTDAQVMTAALSDPSAIEAALSLLSPSTRVGARAATRVFAEFQQETTGIRIAVKRRHRSAVMPPPPPDLPVEVVQASADIIRFAAANTRNLRRRHGPKWLTELTWRQHSTTVEPDGTTRVWFQQHRRPTAMVEVPYAPVVVLADWARQPNGSVDPSTPILVREKGGTTGVGYGQLTRWIRALPPRDDPS